MTYLSDLHPRQCRTCGADTDSPVFDRCAAHDPLFSEYGASECRTPATPMQTRPDATDQPRRRNRDAESAP